MENSNRWKIISVIVALVLGWVAFKILIGITRLAVWFTILGIKVGFFLILFGIIFAVVYFKFRPQNRR
ncbi:hypothetical protein [Geomesophilobacter sediminis]|uniref:Uncharacterized protein n=1 Tax=Geomesophilobacter sediminis TaxID=2798584 RepID=A0A8J7J7V0_9BACT|nr:hypothetical protein [Geomesophilobacter sediminis]MBJ6725486.1 hypothetical protein [Geomesophilobacter sediminis]